MLNRPFKATIKQAYNKYATSSVAAHIEGGGSASNYSLNTHTGALQDNSLAWVKASWKRMRQLQSSIIPGYHTAGTMRMWDTDFQRRAIRDHAAS